MCGTGAVGRVSINRSNSLYLSPWSSDLRYLLSFQELMEARDELHHWTTKLADLKSVIDSVDEDDEELDEELLAQPEPSMPKGGLLDSLLGTPVQIESPPEEPEPQVPESEVASAVDLLKELQGLSEQLLEDAKQDEVNLGLNYD